MGEQTTTSNQTGQKRRRRSQLLNSTKFCLLIWIFPNVPVVPTYAGEECLLGPRESWQRETEQLTLNPFLTILNRERNESAGLYVRGSGWGD